MNQELDTRMAALEARMDSFENRMREMHESNKAILSLFGDRLKLITNSINASDRMRLYILGGVVLSVLGEVLHFLFQFLWH